MSRKLDDLEPEMRKLAVEFLARCVEAGVLVAIVDTRRTKEEQVENVRKGVSLTLHSKHLTGEAFDVCPYSTWSLHGPDKLQWDHNDPVWQQLGRIGESVGLKWALRTKDGRAYDLGHFEKKPK